MLRFIAENKYGQQIEITNNPAYEVVEIDGLNPPDANINTTHNAGYDGETFNSSYMTARQITITLAINSDAEENRINLYKYFISKFPVRLYFTNERRDVYIDGYVKSMPISYFEKKQIVQIVVNCPNPLFKGRNEDIQPFTSINSLLEFPLDLPPEMAEFSTTTKIISKSIINNGEVECGVTLVLRMNGSVENLIISNLATDESMIFNYTFSEGDVLTINTRKGEKACTLATGAQEISVIGYMTANSKWTYLIPGDNVFTIAADEGSSHIYATFYFTDEFEGV